MSPNTSFLASPMDESRSSPVRTVRPTNSTRSSTSSSSAVAASDAVVMSTQATPVKTLHFDSRVSTAAGSSTRSSLNLNSHPASAASTPPPLPASVVSTGNRLSTISPSRRARVVATQQAAAAAAAATSTPVTFRERVAASAVYTWQQHVHTREVDDEDDASSDAAAEEWSVAQDVLTPRQLAALTADPPPPKVSRWGSLSAWKAFNAFVHDRAHDDDEQEEEVGPYHAGEVDGRGGAPSRPHPAARALVMSSRAESLPPQPQLSTAPSTGVSDGVSPLDASLLALLTVTRQRVAALPAVSTLLAPVDATTTTTSQAPGGGVAAGPMVPPPPVAVAPLMPGAAPQPSPHQVGAVADPSPADHVPSVSKPVPDDGGNDRDDDDDDDDNVAAVVLSNFLARAGRPSVRAAQHPSHDHDVPRAAAAAPAATAAPAVPPPAGSGAAAAALTGPTASPLRRRATMSASSVGSRTGRASTGAQLPQPALPRTMTALLAAATAPSSSPPAQAGGGLVGPGLKAAVALTRRASMSK